MNNRVIKDWYEVTRVSEDISLIREKYVAAWLRCNIWHLRGKNYDLLIDSGMGLRPLKREIAILGEKPVTVISTHCHFDHIGGAHEFKCRLGHRLEEALHIEPNHENSGIAEFVRAETFLALPDQKFHYENYRVTPAPLTGYLDEGDVIDLGDRVFQVLHLPGHSPGSIALYEMKTRTLFSGDAIYDGELFDTVYHSEKAIYRESLQRLREFDVETVHGGHFESFGRQRMIEIIDDYLAGRGAMGDAGAWVASQLEK
ncbi:MAG: MBL fold metallo-hydrolase [Gammaproteobacteria bacterium]|nr:MBL fold metallo-hydrolase [Gammaproteobacteria bacterium]MDH3857005.1 MBL fold metallo-hydrolase [Gammaproteobacteria bacterium]